VARGTRDGGVSTIENGFPTLTPLHQPAPGGAVPP
jgi:hypothetical protein